jgi:hypothetical protein
MTLIDQVKHDPKTVLITDPEAYEEMGRRIVEHGYNAPVPATAAVQ